MQKSNFRFLLLLFATLPLLGAALINGYPLLYSDTGTYIRSGFVLDTPVDRPITYGLFIRLFSFNGFSLWPVIIAQSFLLVWLISEVIKRFGSSEKSEWHTLILTSILSLATGLSTVTSQVIADVFAPILILTLLLLLYDHAKGVKLYFLYFILLFSSATHISHFLIALLICLLFFLFPMRKKNRTFSRKKIIPLMLVVFASFIAISVSVSKSSHVFLLGRLSESGILKLFLDENCPTKHYKLCDCKDVLPATADDFIWEKNNSVLTKAGGWQQSKEEANEIIHGTLSSPRYIALQITASLSNTLRQLITIGSGEGLIAYADSTTVMKSLGEFIPKEKPCYEISLQAAGKTDKPELFNTFSFAFFVLAFFFILYAFFAKRISAPLKKMIAFLLLAYLLNGMIGASLVTVANRFGCRVAWLLVFPSLLLLLEMLLQQKKNKSAL